MEIPAVGADGNGIDIGLAFGKEANLQPGVNRQMLRLLPEQLPIGLVRNVPEDSARNSQEG